MPYTFLEHNMIKKILAGLLFLAIGSVSAQTLINQSGSTVTYDSKSLVDTNSTSVSTSNVNTNTNSTSTSTATSTSTVNSNSTNTNNNNNVSTSTNTNNNIQSGTVTNNNNNVNTGTMTYNNNNVNSGTMTYNNNNVSTSVNTNNNINTGTMTYNNNNVSTSTNTNTNNNINTGDMTNRNINTSTATTANTNVNQNTSTATNVNQNIQSGSMTNTNINESNITQRVIQPPPTAVAPTMMSGGNADLCSTGSSGSVQTQVFGVSSGGTIRDLNCERLKLSKTLFDMGMKVAAVATMCQDRRVFDAMMAAGTPCPYEGQIGTQAKAAWEANPSKLPKLEEEKIDDTYKKVGIGAVLGIIMHKLF